MPTYEYKCSACDHEMEEFQSITAKPLRKCPACGKNTLKRLIGTGAGVLFKGEGFWQTDYRSESYKKAAEAEKPKTESKSDAKAEAKSDAKPEPKSEAKKKPDPAAKPAPTPKKKPKD